MKLSMRELRRLIIKEMESMDEDLLVHKDIARLKPTPPLSSTSTCENCGGETYEGSCMECGYTMESINEGGCGCGPATDYSIKTIPMIYNPSGCDACGSSPCGCDEFEDHPLGDFSDLEDTTMTPGEAFGAGYAVSDYDHAQEDLFGINANSISADFPDHPEIKKHGHNNYMAKPSLYKVAKYAQKLLQMIPDGHELDDWQRTKIAQISDDISEVYHSLDYDNYQGDI